VRKVKKNREGTERKGIPPVRCHEKGKSRHVRTETIIRHGHPRRQKEKKRKPSWKKKKG